MSGRRTLGVRWMVAAVTSLGLAAVPLGGVAGAKMQPHTDGAYDDPVQDIARQITLVQREWEENHVVRAHEVLAATEEGRV